MRDRGGKSSSLPSLRGAKRRSIQFLSRDCSLRSQEEFPSVIIREAAAFSSIGRALRGPAMIF